MRTEIKKLKTPWDDEYKNTFHNHKEHYEELELREKLIKSLEDYCDWIFPRRENKETRFNDIDPPLQTLLEELNKDLFEKQLKEDELFKMRCDLESKMRRFQFVGTNLNRNTPQWCDKQDIKEHKRILKQFNIKEYQYKDETSKNKN